MATGRLVVDSPLVFTPRRFGLLSVAQAPELNGHWEAGLTWRQLCPDSDTTYDPCVLTAAGVGEEPFPDPPDKNVTVEDGLQGASPFTVFASIECSPVGVWNDIGADVTTALLQSEEHSVEEAFWTGTAGLQSVVFPHLAADAFVEDADGVLLQQPADVVNPVPQEVTAGLGLLEAALADCYHGIGVIHVPTHVLEHLAAEHLVSFRGGQASTAAGNLVAVGAGYTGSSPAGVVDAGVTWIYATGAVFYARSEVRTFQREAMLERSQNTIEAIAERTYLLGWDCCLFAQPLDLQPF